MERRSPPENLVNATVRVFLASILLLAAACRDQSGSKARRLQLAVPASTSLEDLLPSPAGPSAPAYQPVSRLALRAPLGLPPIVESTGLTAYESSTALLDDGDDARSTWRFGTGEDGLRAALGSAAVDAGRARLAEAYRGYVGSAELRAALVGLLENHPVLSALAPALRLDLDEVQIASMSLHEGLWSDQDGDGSLEVPGSALTVVMTLPAFQVPTPAAPFPACAALVGDGTAPAELAGDSEITWVAPADASWRYRVKLVAHFGLADLSAVHGELWEPTDYPSQGARDAAEYDLGIFAGFLADPPAGLPGSDLIVSVEPDPEFADPTLHVISALARTAGDAECLRELDGWLASVAVLQPALAEDQTTPVGHLVQAYPPGIDAGDGVLDPGLSCLHDSAGNPLAVDGEPACATASGPIEVIAGPTAGTAQLVTPYTRLTASLPGIAPAVSLEIASCTSWPWDTMCTKRFGRGIRLCLAEWAIRSQVGDYWNIHLWQDAGKSAMQSAIKAGAYVLRGAIYVYMGSGETKFLVRLAAEKEGVAYAADVATNFTGKKVAGQSIKTARGGVYDLLVQAYKNSGVVTKTQPVAAGFVIDKVIDGLAQMAEVQATGWQDYSSDSHCKCGFEYRHPNYCDDGG